MELDSQKKYDVIIVNYNGEKIISDCLDSIYACTVKPSKIIIYDNYSKDNSIKLIRKSYPNVVLIEGKENLGFGRANNEAMKHSRSDFILFMNNDILLDKYCPERLLEGFSNPSISLVNPLIIKGWEKNKKNAAIYAFGAEMNSSGFNYGLSDLKENRFDLNSFSAACCMTRGALLRKLKFEKRFFMYGEEAEISSRLLKQGFKIGRIREAKCYHLESYSSPKKAVDGLAFRQFYGVQNRWYMIGKHWPLWLLPSALMLNSFHLVFIVYFLLRYQQFSYLKLIYLAPLQLVAGLLNRDKSQVFDSNWHRNLSRKSLLDYFMIGKKVFTRN